MKGWTEERPHARMATREADAFYRQRIREREHRPTRRQAVLGVLAAFTVSVLIWALVVAVFLTAINPKGAA